MAVAVAEDKAIYMACESRECIDRVLAKAPEEERLAAEPWLSKPSWLDCSPTGPATGDGAC